MKKARVIISVSAFILITALLCSFYVPQLRVRLFTYCYYEQIEEGIAQNQGVPASDVVIGGYKYVNTWSDDPRMTEFVLLQYGDCYYGCYYSPEDVPFSFQNITDNLTENSKNRWEWQLGESNGHTSKMFDNWYYFKAKY